VSTRGHKSFPFKINYLEISGKVLAIVSRRVQGCRADILVVGNLRQNFAKLTHGVLIEQDIPGLARSALPMDFTARSRCPDAS
jgi:hypothetical protein